MRVIVVDASVALQWLLPDRDESAAHALLLGDEGIVAPDVIRLEVTSAVSRRFRDGLIKENDARSAMDALQTLIGTGAIQLIPAEDVWDVAINLSFNARHAFSDCVYLALGKTLRRPVVSADPKMAALGTRMEVEVILLGDGGKAAESR